MLSAIWSAKWKYIKFQSKKLYVIIMIISNKEVIYLPVFAYLLVCQQWMNFFDICWRSSPLDMKDLVRFCEWRGTQHGVKGKGTPMVPPEP